jgi:hypothetical protein
MGTHRDGMASMNAAEFLEKLDDLLATGGMQTDPVLLFSFLLPSSIPALLGKSESLRGNSVLIPKGIRRLVGRMLLREPNGRVGFEIRDDNGNVLGATSFDTIGNSRRFWQNMEVEIAPAREEKHRTLNLIVGEGVSVDGFMLYGRK